MTSIDEAGKDSKLGCFQTASKRILKRKHSDSEENAPKQSRKSIFSTISEKLGFSRPPTPAPKSILSPNGRNKAVEYSGEDNPSYQHGYNLFGVTNEWEQEHENPPRKRVKFDEENLIFSSITYQRRQQHETKAVHLFKPSAEEENKSILTRLINYTANLF